MTDPKENERIEAAAADSSLLLLQVAASEARIGPFAKRSHELPQAVVRSYRDTSRILSRRSAFG